MCEESVRSRIRSGLSGSPQDVDWFLASVQENQRLTAKRFERMAWLLIVLVLLFELLAGGSVSEVRVLGVVVPPQPVRDALPAAIAGVYLALVVSGSIRMRHSEIQDLALAEFRPRLVESDLHPFLRPASLLQGGVLLDGLTPDPEGEPKRERSKLIRRLALSVGPAIMVLIMLLGPPLYIAGALARCYARHARDGSPTALLELSLALAAVFCGYALVVFAAQRKKELPG